MNRLFLVIPALVMSFTCGAQSLKEAIKKTESEQMESAAQDFRKILAAQPALGTNYFYFGENFFKSGDVDSALYMYNKGIEANATAALNYVGVGKVKLQKGDAEGARTQFYKATSLSSNKDAEVFRQIAEAWLVTDTKEAEEAIKMANAAIKLEPKNAENYILLGDAQLEKNPTDGSTPIKSYQKASELNPKSPKGLLRQGRLYQRARNYKLALDFYKQAIALDPNFAPAYREIAELYSMAGQPANSIENWKKYLELNNSEQARYRFMSALYFNKQYAEAIKEYEELKKKNFTNVYLERLAAYSYAEVSGKDSTAAKKGLEAMDNFFKLAGNDFRYIPDDYKYKGLLLAADGRDSLSMVEMNRAIALDSGKAGAIYAELAELAQKNRSYPNVVKYLELKKGQDPKNLSNNDWFALGRAYYFLGQTKLRDVTALAAELKKKKKNTSPELEQLQRQTDSLFVNADSAFVQLVQLNPSWPVGHAWRGRANASLDPDAKSDSTKVHFEKVLSLLKPEEKTGSYKAYAVEAHEYLGYYYVTRKDEAMAKENWLKVKELDPDNVKATYYLNPPKPKAAGNKTTGGS